MQTTLKSEFFAIMKVTERVGWILVTPDGFNFYTDHQNLIFIFDLLAFVSDFPKTSIRIFFLLAVRLSEYNYTCMHINCINNVWADLLGRWSSQLFVRRLEKFPLL